MLRAISEYRWRISSDVSISDSARAAVFKTGICYAYGLISDFHLYRQRMEKKASLRKKMEDGGERSLLIITRKDLAEEVVTNMKKHNYARYKLAGIALMDSYQTGQEIQGIPVVANAERAATYVCQEWIDEVLVVPGDEPYPEDI